VSITACKPWLVAELSVIDPEVVVALGATAPAHCWARRSRLMRDRGKLMPGRRAAHSTKHRRRAPFVMVDDPSLGVLRATTAKRPTPVCWPT